MTTDTPDNGYIDKATRFGERFGFPALVSFILVCSLLYGTYFILRYEVFYTRDKVEAMSQSINENSVNLISILAKEEASLEIQAKQMKIQCATCWNGAANQEEIKRCSCSVSE